MAKVWQDLTEAEKEALTEAAKPLWAALEVHGFVDGHGGSEFSRVFPDTVDFIHGEANPPLTDDEPANGPTVAGQAADGSTVVLAVTNRVEL